MEIILFIVVIGLCFLFFNSTAGRIRKINMLIDKDRSVCDIVTSLDGWSVSPIKNDGLKIVLPSSGMIKELYISYQGRRPSNAEIKRLYRELTNENSIVTKAHKANMPVDAYLREANSTPIKKQTTQLLSAKIIKCCFDMMEQEQSYFKKIQDSTNCKAMAELDANCFIDRLALIYSVLTQMKKQCINRDLFVNYFIQAAAQCQLLVNENQKTTATKRLKEKIDYFNKEIEIEKQCTYFMPLAIIKTLRNPSLPSTSEIDGIDPLEAMRHWGIIIGEIKKTFS